jgi:hypothetical protein
VPFETLDEFISAADKADVVRTFRGADLDLDVGCLTELSTERGQGTTNI